LGLTDRYRRLSDLPSRLPVFPLQGCILLPRATLPLNVFEPRYLAMIDDALAGDRVVGVIQPLSAAITEESPSGGDCPLRRTGGAGRITSFTETEDNRVLITLTGVVRFDVVREEDPAGRPYRVMDVSYASYLRDLESGYGQQAVDREQFLRVLRLYLQARKLEADWRSIERSPPEALINTLSVICPYGPEEKQALLEAPDLRARSEVLMALAQMEIASNEDGGGGGVH
jgi:Lon protease-like protein